MNHDGEDSPVARDVFELARSTRAAIAEGMQRPIDDGEFTPPVEAEVLTQYLTAVLQAIAIQASADATRGDLERVSRVTLAFWPGR